MDLEKFWGERERKKERENSRYGELN